jgi:UPF0755 protein
MARAFKVFLVTTAIGVLLVAVIVYKAWTYPDTVGGTARGPVELEIPKGSGAQQVSELLASKGLLDRPAIFRLYAGQRGVASRFKAGRYKVEAPTTPRALLELMIRGASDELVAVTIPPGRTIVDVAELFAAAGITPKAELLTQATDAGFVRSLELPGLSLEGYLYPDTYRMRPHTPAARALVPLVRRHRQVFEELRAKHPVGMAMLRKNEFDDARIVILASIVEKETARGEERPRIAQLYLNRLIKPLAELRAAGFGNERRLQADPTIIYGCTVAPLFLGKASPACSQWKGNIQYIHLYDKENPFNTYTHEGLPPGPITNPGRAALEAVMKPDGSAYLYFVAKSDGTGAHHFSSNVAEHQAAVVRFQRGGKALPKSRQ